MFRLLSLPTRTLCVRPFLLAGAWLLLTWCSPLWAQRTQTGSVLDDPALRDYRAIDLGIFPAPTAPEKVPAPPPIRLTEPPDAVSEIALHPSGISSPRLGETPSSLPPTGSLEQLPLCALIDFDSDTLGDDLVNAITTQVWNEARRVGRTRLLRLGDSRHILTAYNLTPTDPYRPPPTRRQMARVLQTDFLILGNVNNFEGTYALDLQLYSAANDRIIRSANALSPSGFNGLLKEIPKLTMHLLEPTGHPLPGTAPSPRTTREALLEKELSILRVENERLRQKLQTLGGPAVVKPDPSSMMTAPPEEIEIAAAREPLLPLSPVRHGDKRSGSAKVPLSATEYLPSLPEEAVEGITETETAFTPPPPEPPRPPQPTPTPVQPTPTPVPPAPTPIRVETPAGPSADDKERAGEFYRKSLDFPLGAREGLEPLEKALELDPGNIQYQRALVERLYKTGLFAECARRGKAFVNRGSEDAYLNIYIGAAFTELADYREALEATNRVLKIEPDNGYALYNRALNLYKLSDPESGPAFRLFLERFGNHPAFTKYADSARACLQKLEP